MKRIDRLRNRKAALKTIIQTLPVASFKAKRKRLINLFRGEKIPTNSETGDLRSAENEEELYNVAADILELEILTLKEEIKKREREMIQGYREIDIRSWKRAEGIAKDLIKRGIVKKYRGLHREIDIAHALMERDIPRCVAFITAVRVVSK